MLSPQRNWICESSGCVLLPTKTRIREADTDMRYVSLSLHVCYLQLRSNSGRILPK